MKTVEQCCLRNRCASSFLTCLIQQAPFQFYVLEKLSDFRVSHGTYVRVIRFDLAKEISNSFSGGKKVIKFRRSDQTVPQFPMPINSTFLCNRSLRYPTISIHPPRLHPHQGRLSRLLLLKQQQYNLYLDPLKITLPW